MRCELRRFLVAMILVGAGTASVVRGAAEPRDLVALPLSAMDALRARNLPMTFKGSSFFLAEWPAELQKESKAAGIPFEVLLREVKDETTLFLFELHPGESAPGEWDGRILYRNGLNVVLAAEDAEAQEWALRGLHPLRLWHVPHGWGVPRTELVPFSCSFNATTAEILGKTSQAQWLDWIEKLSGVEPVEIAGASATIATRFTASMFGGAANANGYDFVRQQAQSWGFSGARLEDDPFAINPAGGKNLVLTIPGTTTPAQEVLLTAHLDSIWQFGSSTTSAPGANDNGTGTATLLEAARLLRQYRFGRTVKIVFFTGEEQGLYGSAAFAQDHSMAPIQGVVNLDMFGYDANGDRCFEIHVGSLPQSLDVGNCFNASIGAYSLGLTRDFLTSTATNRSDHASFWNVGVGAIEIAENYFNDGQAGGCVGSEPNPFYHTDNDKIVGNMHPSYAFSIAKGALATIAAMAGPIDACLPAGPSLSAVSGVNQVDLSWSAVPGAVAYRIYRATQGCGGTFVALADATDTSFSDTTVGPSTYAYRVEAVAPDGICVSPESACATATPTVYRAVATGASFDDICPGGGPGSGNGIVDPGETATVRVTIQNTGNTSLNGLVGSLSSSTPGVSVIDGSASWPNLGPGGAAQSIPDHFTLQVDPALPCGTSLALDVATSSIEGAWGGSFARLVGSPATAVTALAAIDVPKTISDFTTVGSNLLVSSTATVQDVNVTVNLTHTYDADVDIWLVAPNGTRVELSTDNGSSGDNYTNTSFDDEAVSSITAGAVPFSGSFRPEGSLSVVDGIPANGTWRLEVSDDESSDTGVLSAWSLGLTTATVPVCTVCTPDPGAPGEAGVGSPVVLSKEAPDLVISWGGPSDLCASVAFSVYRGDLATLASGQYSHDTALSCGVAANELRIPLLDESLGDAAYFLVVSENGTQEGSYGRHTGSVERPSSAAACRPAQRFTACP